MRNKADSCFVLLCLEFADVLEQFESSFYQSALAKFQASDFTAAGFVSPSVPTELFTVIQSDEATHSATLQVRGFCIVFAPTNVGSQSLH